MTGWQLDPAGVRATLANVTTRADELVSAATPVDAAVTEVGAGATGIAAPIAAAVSDAVERNVAQLTSVVERIAAAAAGAELATRAYEAGDLEMAATAQDAAGHADIALFEGLR